PRSRRSRRRPGARPPRGPHRAPHRPGRRRRHRHAARGAGGPWARSRGRRYRGPRVSPVIIPWREAWQEALYGSGGFYRRPEGPVGHFETATHGPVGRALARTLVGLAAETGAEGVVDLGAGRGELLSALRS